MSQADFDIPSFGAAYAEITKLRAELADAQADNERLRGVIANSVVMIWHPDNIGYLDEFAVHEALDRCHMISCLIDDQLLHHQVVASDSKLSELVSVAIGSLGDAYQLLGEYKINARQNIDSSI